MTEYEILEIWNKIPQTVKPRVRDWSSQLHHVCFKVLAYREPGKLKPLLCNPVSGCMVGF